MRFKSRKFLLASFFALTSFILALISKLTGEYITISTLLMSAYGAANITGKKLNDD